MASTRDAHPTPRHFLAACIYDFHRAARMHGLAMNGPALHRELLATGHAAIAEYAASDDLRAEFPGCPQAYEDFMVMLAFDFGLVLGAFWYADRDIFAPLARRVIDRGPVSAAARLIDALFDQPIMADDGAPLLDLLSARYRAMLAPHAGRPDERRYTRAALLACYQLGVSIMLERCAE